MKLKLFGLIAVMLVAQAATAQFHLGVKGGANITKIDGKSFDEEFRYGYHIGGFLEIPISPRFAIHPEVLFNQYNTTLDSSYESIYENVINSEQSKVKLNYLSIPLVLDYKLVGPLHLQAGPQFGILMDQNKNFLENGGEAFKSGDFSMLGGVALQLSSFRITGRYIVGLNNINDIDDQDKWKNQAVQLSLGVAF